MHADPTPCMSSHSCFLRKLQPTIQNRHICSSSRKTTTIILSFSAHWLASLYCRTYKSRRIEQTHGGSVRLCGVTKLLECYQRFCHNATRGTIVNQTGSTISGDYNRAAISCTVPIVEWCLLPEISSENMTVIFSQEKHRESIWRDKPRKKAWILIRNGGNDDILGG